MTEDKNRKEGLFAYIPMMLIMDNSVQPNAKLLYGILTSLASSEGYCWASNEYLSKHFDVHKKTVSVWVSELKDRDYIEVEVESTEKGYDRRIYITGKLPQKSRRGIHEITERGVNEITDTSPRNHGQINITDNNSKDNIYTQKKSDKEFERAMLIYEKWQEITGKKHNPEVIKANLKTNHYRIIERHGAEAIAAGILIYKRIIDSPDHYFSHSYTFWDFIGRAYEKHFLPESDPWYNMLKDKEAHRKKKELDDFINGIG